MSIDAMRQALEALETVFMPHHPAVIALRAAIAEAEKQEPVAWTSGIPPLYPEMKDGETISVEYVEATPPAAYPDFECPRCGHCCPQREWVGLTDDEVLEIERYAITKRQATRSIEAKLKEKNT